MLMVDVALVRRAGELKSDLVAFSQQPRYDRAAFGFLAEYGDGLEDADEQRWMLLWDCFILEHRLPNGRTVVDQFVDSRPQLSEAERQMVLGWRDVVQGPFEVKRREGPVLVVECLVDDLTYRVRSTMGPAVFRQMPRRSFIIARLVAVGDEWMLSGSTRVLRASECDLAFRLALETSLSNPETVFRNPEKLARAWEQQRADRARFVEFFGADLVVLPGEQAQERLDAYYMFCRDAVLGPDAAVDAPPAVSIRLPPDLTDADTVAVIYDETDGLGFYAEFGLVEEAFANPGLLRRRRWREQALSYLDDDSVEPMVLRRLGDRDPGAASAVFRRLLKRPRFDWNRDGEDLLRELRPGYYAQAPRPRVSPLSERLAEFAKRR